MSDTERIAKLEADVRELARILTVAYVAGWNWVTDDAMTNAEEIANRQAMQQHTGPEYRAIAIANATKAEAKAAREAFWRGVMWKGARGDDTWADAKAAELYPLPREEP